jgi:ATP-dependent Clp protease ATP-binding subunit ClpA
VIQRRIEDFVALAVLEGRYRDGDTIRVDAQGDTLSFD